MFWVGFFLGMAVAGFGLFVSMVVLGVAGTRERKERE